jgi:DNA repair protein RadC
VWVKRERGAAHQAIIEVARPLGIAVHDHIIVGKEGHASLKGLKLI